jgi:hypothetical protein
MQSHFIFPTAVFLTTALSIACLTQGQNTSPYWSVVGNSNATASTAKLGTTNGYPLRLTTNNATRLYITSTGNVGIGTTTPAQRLHVEGTSNQAIFVSTSALGTTSGSGMVGYVKATPTAAGQRLGYYLLGSRGGAQNNYSVAGMSGYAGGAWSSTSRPAYLAFETTPAGSINKVERLRIDPNGNVGIGVANPELPLEVAGRMRLRSAGGSTAGLWLNNLANSSAIGFMGVSNDDYIGLWGNTGAGWGLIMNTTTGHVGIGTPNPFSPLFVQSSKADRIIEARSTSSGNYSRMGLYADAVNAPGYGYGVWSQGGNRGVVGVGSGGSYTGEVMGVSGAAYGSAGNRYGIFGTASGGSFNAAGYFSGNVYSNGVLLTSDRKFKEETAPLENSLEQLMKLRPTSYQFKTNEYHGMNLPTGKQLGLIADEVKQVFPELVSQAVHPAEYDKEDITKVITPEIKYEGVNYQGLIPVLIASVQEQQKQLKNQQKQNDALKTEVAELRQMIMDMKYGSTNSVSSNTGHLEQNSPNPVRSSTRIFYSLPEGVTKAYLQITDALGRTIKTLQLTASGVLSFDASSLSSGVYNYSLVVDNKTVQTRKMTVLK